MEGWIKLHRKLKDWEWYNNSKMVHLFIHLLLSANHKAKKWRGISVSKGQLITGRKSLSEDTGISEQSIRTCIKKLKSTNEITINTTSQYSIITICKYDDYQLNENDFNQQCNQLPNQQSTNDQPTINQQLTTNKNEKNEKNEKNKSIDFVDKIINKFCEVYKNEREIDYIITNKGKEKSCAGKILKIAKEKYPNYSSEEMIQMLEDYFKLCINIDDNWLFNNMSLSIIISKFNEINTILKNGTNRRNNKTGATDRQIIDVINAFFSE